jgi:hypothetical protein
MKREDTEDVTISCNYMETKKTDREIVIQTTNSATESDSVTTVISSTKTEVFEFDGDNGIRSSGVHLERKTTSKDETPKLSE